jgi:hypothetical protein
MVIADEVFDRGSEVNAVAVLEWRAWNGFLLNHVLGEDAVLIETDPFSDLPSTQFDRICDSCAIVCFQINLSVRGQLPLPIRDLTERFSKRGVHVVNGLVQDIRKSTLHAHLEHIGLRSLKAIPSGPPNELLFVKTSLNYGGELERWLPPESVAAARLEGLVSPDIGAYHYEIVKRRALPDELWTDPAIVVEKYIHNREDSFYRAYFSGKQIIIVHCFTPGVIKKMSGDPRDTNYMTDLEHLQDETDGLELSAALKRDVATFVERTPIEFGCVDIVHDGHDNHYIIDLNLTPYAGNRPHDPCLTTFLKWGITDPARRKPLLFLNSPLCL